MTKKAKNIFSLDIGTRSIVGIILEDNPEGVVVKEMIIKEHTNRSMLDGQIHNIPQVSALVKEVKQDLEKKANTKLKNVAVAAAGRSLKTVKTKVSHDFNGNPISAEDVLKLELKGAQEAQRVLFQENKNENNYYCVGYSVINYYLDGAIIGSLIGQKGITGCVEIVGAFLPKIVVDSLQTVLQENNLKLSNITLEPIAAINVILPPTMRKLNIALVDVGAGTSDIAISSSGSIIAYGMVPMAGDEITEAICDKFLLDFYDGEKIKRVLDKKDLVNFIDVLGFEHTIESKIIIDNITEAVKKLAEQIGKEVLLLNGKPPQGILLIGGGSQTPLLTYYLAEYLNLPKERVAVQNAKTVKNLLNLPQDYQGPEIITPLGIGITALKYSSIGFISVEINGIIFNILNVGNIKVADALLGAGLKIINLFGKPGLALSCEVNGIVKLIPGTLGKPAIIEVNGKAASLDTILRPKDKIKFTPAEDGLPGKSIIKDLLPEPLNYIYLNGEKRDLPFEILMDGVEVSKETEIKNGSKIYLREIRQIGELLAHWNIIENKYMQKFTLIFNGAEKTVNLLPIKIEKEGLIVELYDQVNPGSSLTIYEQKEVKTIAKILKAYIKEPPTNVQVEVNNQVVNIPNMDLTIKLNGQEVGQESLINNDDIIEIQFQPNSSTPLLLDLFKYIDFPTTPPIGKSQLKIIINKNSGEYTTPLHNGDFIELVWQ